MDTKTTALWDAAFHAWVALGELLLVEDRKEYQDAVTDQRAELSACYAELQAAIDALKVERGRAIT
jgi:hypothetical protein